MRKLSSKQNALRTLCAILAAMLLIGILLTAIVPALAESVEPNAYILRRQADNVLVQKAPGTQPYQYWRYWDNDPPCGAELMLTGNRHGKWLECIALYLPEQPTGWIREEFIVTDKPTECGLIATVVKPVVVGDWQLVKGDRVKVLYRSESLCTTIWGMVPTECLDFALTGEVTEPRKLPDWLKRDHILCVIDW